MGVPPNHPFYMYNGIFYYKPFIWGYPHLWKPPYLSPTIETIPR